MTSKNNPNRTNKKEENTSITHPKFYGFAPGFWCGSNADTIEEARADIKRILNLKKSAEFEVKPYVAAAYQR